jgi:hypothetical protein
MRNVAAAAGTRRESSLVTRRSRTDTSPNTQGKGLKFRVHLRCPDLRLCALSHFVSTPICLTFVSTEPPPRAFSHRNNRSPGEMKRRVIPKQIAVVMRRAVR